VPDPSLRLGGFAFRINAIRTLPRIGLPADRILVNDEHARLVPYGVDAVPTLNPATWQPGALVDRSHAAMLDEAGFTTWDAWGFLILCFAAALRTDAHRLLTRDVATDLLRRLGEAFPELERATLAHVGVEDLTVVLRALLLDGVSIRNLPRIAKALLRYELGDPQPARLDRVSFVRAQLADVIANKVSRGTSTAVVYLLHPEIERALAAAEPDADVSERLVESVRTEVALLPRTAQTPAIITQPHLRARVRELLRHAFPHLTLLAYGELPPSCNVQPIARIPPA
jgi:type III secretion protein V